MKRSIDGDNVTLRKEVFQILDAASTDLLLGISRKGLVVVVYDTRRVSDADWVGCRSVAARKRTYKATLCS